jgi:hypothetical protein
MCFICTSVSSAHICTCCTHLHLLQVGYRRDQYKRCANLLEAVSQLLEYFAHYQDVPKIQSLTKRLTTVQVGPAAGAAALVGPSIVKLWL